MTIILTLILMANLCSVFGYFMVDDIGELIVFSALVLMFFLVLLAIDSLLYIFVGVSLFSFVAGALVGIWRSKQRKVKNYYD